ncbi:hypothetical protein CRUP_007301 [Coryphaenoides rupestris]|nr:hypothetical protein CRUP_007301 [Coryphaenoides rupestris]
MAKLVECVPNFSEGRDKKVIDAISEAISKTVGCSLLDVDPGSSTNRTVYTFVGSPDAVVEGALNAAHTAFSLIDMTSHTGSKVREEEEASVPVRAGDTKEQAHRIAMDVREQGRGKDQESQLAQVSTNLLDYEDLNLPVVGSQIVGLVPLKALLDSADFYIKRDQLFILQEEHKVRLVISKFGLDSLGPFNPKERIIDLSTVWQPGQLPQAEALSLLLSLLWEQH